MTTWWQCSLGDQITLQRGVDITRKESSFGSVPVISSGGLSFYHNVSIDNGPGVVIGRKGSLGTVYWVNQPYWPHDTTLWVKDFKGNDSRFVYYALKSLDTKSLDVGSSNPTLNRNHVHPIQIWWTNLDTQREITTALSALDDKIELNRRIAGTLEEMARALYRSWFVDFDPVRAKAEGREPAHMDGATAALFPDRFGEDGLPEGWHSRSLEEVADFLNGAALQKFPPEEGCESLPVIKIAELRLGITEKTARASANLPTKYRINNGDVLFSWSGSLLQKVWTEGAGALNQHLFKVTSEHVPKWFHYYAVDQHMDEFRQIAASKATTMGHIQRRHLREAMVALPDDPRILEAAGRIVAAAFDRAIAASLENQTLAELRDTLLPKLMSGDIRVGEAREMAEAAE
ncbi:type I restriction enzyme, S subunit [Fulvimarina manganoxydans]|uniref:Type I restriction enzyme, S subunit n=1 Tax=Fulvimarina manganoxydans TaxID=937218 RepID=A0A1W2ARB0_9HYPH|nr:restriction endonuclease subunit S [Fulvimarina manganoxydans]SMC63052.1 type I restriction enzyme, S subunit [Fulvimarina manganoxydans]